MGCFTLKDVVVSIDLFSVFFMPFLYNGVCYRWFTNCLPHPLLHFVLLSAQTDILHCMKTSFFLGFFFLFFYGIFLCTVVGSGISPVSGSLSVNVHVYYSVFEKKTVK